MAVFNYTYLAGASGGQQINGGTGNSEDLDLISTTGGTKGKVKFGAAGTSAYKETEDRLGIGTNAPSGRIEVNTLEDLVLLILKLKSSHTANALEIKDSSSNIICKIDCNGDVFVGDFAGHYCKIIQDTDYNGMLSYYVSTIRGYFGELGGGVGIKGQNGAIFLESTASGYDVVVAGGSVYSENASNLILKSRDLASSRSAAGRRVTLRGGAAANADSGNYNGGDVYLEGGAGKGTGTTGKIYANGNQVTALGNDLGYQVTVYASGTAYALTATPGLITFGTTSPEIVINKAGTYMLLARLKLNYNGATFASSQTVTVKLRRANNTPADVANTSTTFSTQVITTQTYTAGDVVFPQAIYTTANTDDNIEMWGSIDVIPSVGTIEVAEANIVAIRLY